MRSNNIFPDEFPIIETERLILREITKGDREAMFHNYSDIDVAKWFFENPLKKIEEVDEVMKYFSLAFERRNGLTWAIEIKDNHRYVGTCGFEKLEINHYGDIGFDLAKEYWRRGIMSEALSAMIHYGFEVLGLLSITAHTYSNNLPARQLLEKLDFKINIVKEDQNETHYILNK
ncbi:MAG: GNAT family N-acetyltransferase [Candidatus Kariarchaeaceae archaeon]|jgi:ribosomal-protein-alanine N-acetyltransferase